MGREIFRIPCGDVLQVSMNSWDDLTAICEKDRGHAPYHEGRDDNGDWHRWKDD